METTSGLERRNMGSLQNRPYSLFIVSDGNRSYTLFSSVEEQHIHINTVVGGANVGSGIRIRTRQPRIQSPENFVSRENCIDDVETCIIWKSMQNWGFYVSAWEWDCIFWATETWVL